MVTSGDVEDKDGDLKRLMSTPNSTQLAIIETYNKNLQLLKQELSGRSGLKVTTLEQVFL